MEKEPVITCKQLRNWIERNRFGKYVEINRLEGFVEHHEKTWKIACQLNSVRNNEDARCSKCGMLTRGEEVAVTKRGIVHLKCLK